MLLSTEAINTLRKILLKYGFSETLSKRFITLLKLTALFLLGYTVYVTYQEDRKVMMLYDQHVDTKPEQDYAATISFAIEETYLNSGRIIRSLPEFGKSAFYPYTTSFPQFCRNEQLSLFIKQSNNQYLCE